MRIAIVTDAWKPQVNGVVQTLSMTRDELESLGHVVLMVTPEGRRTIPLPTYAEIRLAVFPGRSVRRELDAFDPDCVHIATEGTLGLAARNYCRRRRLPFTSAYHTQFPEYARAGADSDRLDGLATALVSPTCRARHGADTAYQGKTGEPWLRERGHMAARCRHRVVLDKGALRL